ncbi:helix-turn-helix transcriptional regulator [Streptomyces zagrosensis]|uniref:AraC-like DNA-binding protein n=1 Tax=Streptomyces zagrosensis TaxID=1042984 RepID=A0A7W9QAC3_9ACTN|nr:helix-turn-helix transcriptional regulator [Streptomyces zagrosensis]MBB5936530.1 AraC-like DNA-binding protein [Streptomyces zagrosensis]
MATALPAAALRPGVVRYRGFRLDLALPRRRLELPDHMATFVILFGQQLHVCAAVGQEAGQMATYGSLVAGPQARARIGEHDGRLAGVEVVLAPWAAYTLFGTRMDLLANWLVGPDDLLGARFQGLDEQLSACPDWATRFALLDVVLARWFAVGPPVSARVRWAWDQLSRTVGNVPVRELAKECGWSERHLERRFGQQIGLRPKSIARLMRLRGALRLLTDGHSGASAAALSGYADQGHLTREFKAMTGWTPVPFLRARALRHGGPPDVDRAKGQPTSLVLPS